MTISESMRFRSTGAASHSSRTTRSALTSMHYLPTGCRVSKVPLKLTWRQLQGQIGSECEPTALARKVRDILPTVLRAYPNARVQAEPQQGRMPGYLALNPSPPAVPKTSVSGFRLVEGRGEEGA